MVIISTIDSEFIYNVPRLVLNTWSELPLILMTILQGNYHYYLYFTDEETDAQRG